MTVSFPVRSEYHNFVFVKEVRRISEIAENRMIPLELRVKSLMELRQIALGYALAAEAARAGLWLPSDGQLSTAEELSTAAGQLYLRAARLDHLFSLKLQGIVSGIFEID